MNFKFLVIFLFSGQFLSAQFFTEHPLTPPFEGLELGSIAYADVDNDGDQDVMITGLNINEEKVAKMYLNDGQGKFTEKPGTSFVEVDKSSIAFSDVDGDGDEDLLITGRISLGNQAANLYINDGQGNFQEEENTPFLGVEDGSVAFSDVDGDNDYDLVVTGRINLASRTSKLFLNNGTGNFVEDFGAGLANVDMSSVVFLDIDGDNDEDLLISGKSSSSNSSQRLYYNDGQGNFETSTSFPINGDKIISLDYSDLDGDNDIDFVVIENNLSSYNLKLRMNDGQGNFIEEINFPIEDITAILVRIADIDGDEDSDILLVGYTYVNGFFEEVSKLYQNNGQADYTEVSGLSIPAFSYHSLEFSDVDGDGDTDFLTMGTIDNIPLSKLYLNDGQGNFTNPSLPFVALGLSSIAFSDVNGDGNEDLLVTRTDIPSSGSGTVFFSKLYISDGDGKFTGILNTPFIGVSDGSIAFSDVDGDDDQDVLISGFADGSRSAKLYVNDGQGNFTEVPNTPFIGVTESSISFSDVDGDGDPDLMITGASSFSVGSTNLYINDGTGDFTLMLSTSFQGVRSSSVAFADVDGDEDKDVVITGITGSGINRISKLYTNDGLGNFTEIVGTPFEGVNSSSIAFSDVDRDGDEDLLITGVSNSGPISKLYINDAQGNFTEVTGTPFIGVLQSSIAFSDIDGDGDEDVLITGNNSPVLHAKLYMNDGQGNFSELVGAPFEGVQIGSIGFSDIDDDHDMDVFITGINSSDLAISKLYINQSSNGTSDISGICYYDQNENQVKDIDEITLSNQLIQITPDPVYSYTTPDGQYRFYVETGDYQITAIPTENWQLTTDTIIDVTLEGQSLENINFGFIPISDVQLIVPDVSSGPTRCSFNVPFWLSYQNNGTTYESGSFEFSLTDGATLQEAIPTPDEIIDNKLYWYFTDFAPLEAEHIRLILKMPDATSLGDTLDFTATTSYLISGTDTTQKVIYNYNPTLNCAYDPNDKAVLPEGVGDDNLTLFDSELEYKIRFQNTGTDTAFTVRIEDDLDPNLDWNTFRPVSASHPYEVDMDVESGRVTFLFRNILLPDSIVNEPLSHGFVKYKISPLDNLSEETEITNEAAIFFDFNEPILTNMTLNTMVSMLTNTTEPLYSNELKVIPNPFQKTTIFKIEEIPGNRGTLNIYDTNGVLVFSELVVSNRDVTYRNETLASGIYFYEVVNPKGARVFGGKVIKY